MRLISGAGKVTDGESAGSDHLAISRRLTPLSREVNLPLTPLVPLDVEGTGDGGRGWSLFGLSLGLEYLEGGGGVLLLEVERLVEGERLGGGELLPDVEGLGEGERLGEGDLLPEVEGVEGFGDFDGEAPEDGGSNGS